MTKLEQEVEDIWLEFLEASGPLPPEAEPIARSIFLAGIVGGARLMHAHTVALTRASHKLLGKEENKHAPKSRPS